MNITVAVRVRPLAKRERDINSQLCVSMNGSSTTITNPKDGKSKTFTYDHSFWSYNGFETDENGYHYPIDDKYSDQQKVYDLLGKDMLENAWKGYNCCLFSYGQTGSGKSYSLIGYGANKGIVPILVHDLFERIEANKDPNVNYQVNFSMLEVYNEKVQDLLIPPQDRPKKGYDVIESSFGVVVKDLNKTNSK